jgi:hypothetical protein
MMRLSQALGCWRACAKPWCVSAATAGIDVLTIRKQTRHQSLSVLQEYVDTVDRWDEGCGLRGIKRGKKKEVA